MMASGEGGGSPPRRVNPRDVFTVLWVTLVFVISLFLLHELSRFLIWMVIAIFAAAVLSPLVAFLVRRGLRRGLAVAIVVIAVFVLGGLVTFAFVQPLITAADEFSEDVPELVEEIQSAPIVKNALDRFNVEARVDKASSDLPKELVGFSGPLLDAFKTLGEFVIGAVTISVLMIFLLLYGPGFFAMGLERINDPAKRRRVKVIGGQMLTAVSGWVAGNVVTSLVAGVVSLIVFLILDLPYAVLLALWVAVADLIPLVGATLGALPAIILAFIGGVPGGLITTGYFIGYQQFENHVLQPYVYGKTIQLNPFVVLVALIIGVELAGFLGALLALPIAGSVQVLLNNLVGPAEPHDEPLPAEPPPSG